MSFYKDKAYVATEINTFIQEQPNPPQSFDELCRKVMLRTGFGRKTVMKIFNELYPSLTIEEGMVVRRG